MRYSFASGMWSVAVTALLVMVVSLDPVAYAYLFAVPVRLAIEEVVHRDPPKEEMGVVLPRVPDPPEHLEAPLSDVDTGVADPYLRHASDLHGIRAVGLCGAGGCHRHCFSGLERKAHIGELVLDGLERSDRAAKRDPIYRVLTGHLEQHIHRADRFCYRQHQ